MENRLFAGKEAYVSTFDFHENRPRAPHLEQVLHRHRLELARDYVHQAINYLRVQDGISLPTVTDLGCGDGGLLSILDPNVSAWGYDFCPANQAGWEERGVTASPLNFITAGSLNPTAVVGDVAVMTEVLEHLSRPHSVLRELSELKVRYLVASSPWTETLSLHDHCHAWCWDLSGYSEMMLDAGWAPVNHTTTGMFQVLLRKNIRV